MTNWQKLKEVHESAEKVSHKFFHSVSHLFKKENEKWEMKKKTDVLNFFQKRTDLVKTLETTALTVQ